MNPPIDLYALHLLRLVGEHRNFSAAALEAGISQSALSRQVAKVEARLGLKLFERTTRQVTITEAGAILLRETSPIPNILEGALRRLREECLEARPRVKVALSTELSLSHIPGIFHSNENETQILVSQEKTTDLIEHLIEGQFDLGIFAESQILPDDLLVTHRMKDRFVAIAPISNGSTKFKALLHKGQWILPPTETQSRQLIDHNFPDLAPSMELENFDLMVQLVALGMGCAFVPRRGLSSFNRKKQIKKITLPKTLERTLVVAIPKHLQPSEHVRHFIEGILFS
ncbi:MAG: DNA-binding transcriptional LysR family regulator [Paracoccaceae bacterium]|jgi:DNA-binding transcriptional LysR family regulator